MTLTDYIGLLIVFAVVTSVLVWVVSVFKEIMYE